jgi:hypothetical protein
MFYYLIFPILCSLFFYFRIDFLVSFNYFIFSFFFTLFYTGDLDWIFFSFFLNRVVLGYSVGLI